MIAQLLFPSWGSLYASYNGITLTAARLSCNPEMRRMFPGWNSAALVLCGPIVLWDDMLHSMLFESQALQSSWVKVAATDELLTSLLLTLFCCAWQVSVARNS